MVRTSGGEAWGGFLRRCAITGRRFRDDCWDDTTGAEVTFVGAFAT